MLTSKSTRNCRLSPDAPAVIRAVSQTGLTTGVIDPSCAHGKTRRKGKGPGTQNTDGRKATPSKLSRRERKLLYKTERGL